jgi:hypothetical protein
MTECGNRQNPLKREVHLTRQNVCARPIAGAIGDPGFEATGGSGAGKGRDAQRQGRAVRWSPATATILPIASRSPQRRSRPCQSNHAWSTPRLVCDDTGMAVFDLIRGHGRNSSAILCAFDLLEVNGEDIRREPIEDRKRRLAGLLRLPHEGIALNEHYEGDGATIFKHACALGCEGIVSKRRGSPYRAGRSPHWLKVKNPAAPAVKREAEEQWR